jgi:hypothetical protein
MEEDRIWHGYVLFRRYLGLAVVNTVRNNFYSIKYRKLLD